MHTHPAPSIVPAQPSRPVSSSYSSRVSLSAAKKTSSFSPRPWVWPRSMRRFNVRYSISRPPLISEAFKYSHIVLASVTYNLGIYPVMHNLLMDMKALNLQNRTFALIENGSWACKSGDLMQKFIDEELKNMTVLNERLTLASSLHESKAAELDALADAIVESMK